MSLSYKYGRMPSRPARTPSDRLGLLFMGSLFAGAFFCFSNLFAPPFGLFPVAGPITVTLVYSMVAIATVKRGKRFDFDQVGDSCYYLGFMLTLFALIATLLSMGEGGVSSGDRVILERFGAALSTTVIGMLFRVLLVQFRGTPAEQRSEADERIAKAMVDMSTSVSHTVSEFERSLRQATSTLGATTTEVREEIQRSAEEQSRALKRIADDLETNLARTSNALQRKIDDVEFEPAQFRDGMQELAKAINEEIDGFREQLAGLKRTASQHGNAWEKLTEKITKAGDSVEGAQDLLGSLDSSLDALSRSAGASARLAEELERLTARIAEAGAVIDSKSQVTGAQIDETRADLETVRRLRAEIDDERKKVAEAVDQVFNHLAKGAETIVNRLDRSNGA